MQRTSSRFALATLPALLALISAPALAQNNSPTSQQESKLPEVQVLGAAEQKYATKISTTATKTDTLLRDTPQAITVITKELMKDQAMQSMADAIRYVPGVVTAQGEGNRDTAVFRGNSSTSDFFVDGIRDDVQYYRDFYNIESVEALKGSNAMIFGRGGSGGIINRVTKQAQWAPVREASVTIGSWNNRRGTVDLGQAIDQSMAFRVTGMVENSDSFRDGVNIKRSGINPTFAIRAGQNTSVVLGYEHFNDERVADRGIPSYQGKPLVVGNNVFFGNSVLSPSTAKVDAFTALIEHDLGNGISLRNRSRFADYDKFYQNVFPNAVNATATTVALNAYNTDTQRKNFFNQTDLTFDLHAAGVKHKILTGLEIGQQTTDNLRQTGYFPSVGVNATSISVALKKPYTDGVTFRQSDSDARNHSVAKTVAVYAQDQIEFSPQWQAIVGLRYDRFGIEFNNQAKVVTGSRDIKTTDTPVSPRAGLIYKPMTDMSLYASYSLAFMPRSGEQLSSLTFKNKELEPEKFKNFELGAKWDVLRDLSLSAAIYQLDRSNVAINNPADPNTSILVDGQRTQGLELAISGKINSAWSIMGGYAYQDAKITRAQSETIKAGATLAQVPTHSASLWNRYDINQQWGVAAGVVYRSAIYPSTDNTVILPGYTRVDAALYYAWDKQIQLQLNIENLSDKTYYAAAHSNNNITPGSPRAIRLGVHFKY